MGREHQSRILFVSLLESYCRTYDDDPLSNRRLFFAICRTLYSMGIIGKEYVDEMSAIRSTYSDAFRKLVAKAQDKVSASSTGASTFENMMIDMQRSRYHDDFIQLRCLGKGGFGKVYEVRNKLDGRRYAVKQIKIKGEITAEKTLREIKTLANLDHPNIVRYYSSWIEVTKLRKKGSYNSPGMSISPQSLGSSMDFGQSLVAETSLFVQMQLCQTTLQEFLVQRNERIAQLMNIRLFRAIVEGVKYFHNRGVIHRDLKGANVFLDIMYSDSGVVSFIPRIGDFGLATKSTLGIRASGDEYAFIGNSKGAASKESGSLNMPTAKSASVIVASPEDGENAFNEAQSGGDYARGRRGSIYDPRRTSNVGTITYAAPEQLCDKTTVYNEKADIYSLGIIFFELYYPFATAMERIAVIKDLRRGVFPPQFLQMWPKEAALILQLMDVDPAKRPSAKEVLSFDLIDVPTLESAQLKREVNMLKQQLRLANQRNEELGLRVRELERIVDMSI
ncbi:kinase-like domain-containing protein [Coemansia spiralis]|nr:kinase-like domain-containing protein [Coemansia spiralis]